MDDVKAKIAGWGRRFTFGRHPDGSIGSVANPTAISSCMTSEKGPLDTRFKHCDTTKVFSCLDFLLILVSYLIMLFTNTVNELS